MKGCLCWLQEGVARSTACAISAQVSKRRPFNEGAQDLPPGLDQVEAGRVLGLEGELPARMEPAEQQHVRRAVGVAVIEDGIDALTRRIDPGFDRAQEIDPVGGGAVLIGLGEGLAGWKAPKP